MILNQIVIGDTIFSKEQLDDEIKYFIRSLSVPEREEITKELYDIAEQDGGDTKK